ncbi:UDP-N-acetylmuramoyl-L-alanine--D-glutamate ligase, partial [Patescibacteria group bacterium]|nr:UDP-N-acetylmuramoyl-L-alanine--D-glutamate ligase [Patescibacteria group bacterium]
MTKKVTIMGLGNYKDGSGISATKFFAQRGYEVLVTDLKSANELRGHMKTLSRFKNIKYILGRHRKEDFKKANLVFQNPSVPDSSPYLKVARKNNIPIINDWSIFLENFDNFLIGITGTRGKSTTTSLIHKFIKTKTKNVILCGNLGPSPLKYFNKIDKKTIIVAELSSWLLRGFKSAETSPNIAVLTNLMVDHLDKYNSLKEYYSDKENIFKFQNKNDYFVVNLDDTNTAQRARKSKARTFFFSRKYFPRKNGVYIKDKNLYFRTNKKKKKICSIDNIKLAGEHNLYNVLAAVTVAMIYGVPQKNIKQVLEKFCGLPNRLEFIKETNGIKFYNDTTATSPDGAIAALKSFSDKKGKIILLAGGSDKGLDFREFAGEITNMTKAIILFKGTASDKIINLLKKKYKK